jgi:hypothetical protein
MKQNLVQESTFKLAWKNLSDEQYIDNRDLITVTKKSRSLPVTKHLN